MDNDMPIDLSREGNNPVWRMPVSAQIQSLTVIDTGTYMPQMRRPFVTNGDANVVGSFLENIGGAIQNNSSITPFTIAQSGNNLLGVSTQAEPSVPIPNGWSSNRLRFILAVKIQGQLSNDRVAYFQGYTEFADNSFSGLIDPNATFFINSFVVIDDISVPTPAGMMSSPRVIESTNILPWMSPSTPNSMAIYQPTSVPSSLMPNIRSSAVEYMRPNDVFMAIQTGHTADMANSTLVYDTRAPLGETKSFKQNHGKSQYLSSLVENYVSSLRVHERGGAFDTRATILENSLNRQEGAPLKDNAFIRMLSKAQGSNYNAVTHFTINLLADMDPDLPKKVRYIRQGNAVSTSSHNSENWGSQSRECIAATIILQSLSSMMLDLMISEVYITSTNMTLDGKTVSRVVNSLSITGADISQQLNLLLLRFEKEIMYDITFGNQDIYSLNVHVDLLGASKIELSLSGGPMVPFTQASFADSLYAPVVTANPQIKQNLVGDMEFILDSVSNVNLNPQPIAANQGLPNNDPGF